MMPCKPDQGLHGPSIILGQSKGPPLPHWKLLSSSLLSGSVLERTGCSIDLDALFLNFILDGIEQLK